MDKNFIKEFKNFLIKYSSKKNAPKKYFYFIFAKELLSLRNKAISIFSKRILIDKNFLDDNFKTLYEMKKSFSELKP